MKKLPILVKIAIIIVIVLLIAIILVFGIKAYGSNLNDDKKVEEQKISQVFENVQSIKMNLQKLELEIKQGEEIKIEYTENITGMKIEQNEGILNVSDEDANISDNIENQKVVIYMPTELKFEEISLILKDRNVSIQTLNASDISIEINGNYCEIENILADNFNLKDQNGKIMINNGDIKNVTTQSSNANDKLNFKITENANVNLNDSNMEFNLFGQETDYQINTKMENTSWYYKMGRMDNGEQIIGNGKIKIDINAQNSALYFNYKQND